MKSTDIGRMLRDNRIDLGLANDDWLMEAGIPAGLGCVEAASSVRVHWGVMVAQGWKGELAQAGQRRVNGPGRPRTWDWGWGQAGMNRSSGRLASDSAPPPSARTG